MGVMGLKQSHGESKVLYMDYMPRPSEGMKLGQISMAKVQ